MKRPPLLALLTDFGGDDQYAGVMKGVLHALLPSPAIVDLTHGVPPGAVTEGAFLLWSAFPWFPPRTVFVAVVDPGVGTTRPILAVRAAGRYCIAPDNGLLKFILADFPPEEIRALQPARVASGVPSATFHGRDLFAPAAARIAAGRPLASLGPRARPQFGAEPFLLLGRAGRGKGAAVTGAILHIDRFGNIVTNVRTPPDPEAWTVRLGGRKFRRSAASYAAAPPGVPFLIGGSSGLLEISLRNGSAARLLGVTTRHRPVFSR